MKYSVQLSLHGHREAIDRYQRVKTAMKIASHTTAKE
jgi:hypothetical protein